jgi:hypothetical protein
MSMEIQGPHDAGSAGRRTAGDERGTVRGPPLHPAASGIRQNSQLPLVPRNVRFAPGWARADAWARPSANPVPPGGAIVVVNHPLNSAKEARPQQRAYRLALPSRIGRFGASMQ